MRTTLLLLLSAAALLAQSTPSAVDCRFTDTFTSATTGAARINDTVGTPCVAWRVTVNTSGFSVISIQFETSPDNSTFTAVPNNICSGTVPPPCVIDGANPDTTTGSSTFSVKAYGKFVRLNVTTATGSGTIGTNTLGYKGLSAQTGGAGGGSVPFSGITTGTNTSATMTCGAGCSVLSASTGTITINGIRAYTVGTLPSSSTVGAIAYVTDGTSATDCTTGGASTKVLCIANGAAWVAEGGTGTGGPAGGALTGTYPNPTLNNITFTSSQNCIPFGSSTAGQITCSAGSGGQPYNIYFNDTASSGNGVLHLRGGMNLAEGAGGAGVTFQSSNNGIFRVSNGIEIQGGTNNTVSLHCSDASQSVNSIGVCGINTLGSSTAVLNVLTPDAPTFGGGSAAIDTLVVTGGKGSDTASGTAQNGSNISMTTGNGGASPGTNGNAGNLTLATGRAGNGAGAAGVAGSIIFTVNAGTAAGRVDGVAHWNTSGSAPTLTSCGGGTPAVTGDDNTGTITVGTGSPTACTVNFANAWNANPVCLALTNSTTALASVSAVGTSSVTFTFAAAPVTVYYQCRQHR